jgi:two-component system sensor histidine kinase YesM
MQANYDALQLQINPHFLYNVLHVISQKGLDSDNNEICEMCSDLASMMRYSTSTLTRTATIQEEVNHVTAYVSLMKKRYENRIDFTAYIDENIASNEIPKITLQQFVENAITHSFEAGIKEVSVEIRCVDLRSTCNEYGWSIYISDNGEGFSEETISRLQSEISKLSENLLDQSVDFAIGGMGILNTYARLFLFFGDSVNLELGNNPGGGAYVLITKRDMKE